MIAELFDRPKESLDARGARVEPRLEAKLERSNVQAIDINLVQTSLLDIFDEEAKAVQASQAVVQGAMQRRKDALVGVRPAPERTEWITAPNANKQLDLLEQQLEVSRQRMMSQKAEKLAQRVLETKSNAPRSRPLVPANVKVAQPFFKPWHWVIVGVLFGFAIGMAYAIAFTPNPHSVTGLVNHGQPVALLGHSVWGKAVFGAVFGGMWGVVPWMVSRQKEAVSHIEADGMLRSQSSPAVYSSW